MCCLQMSFERFEFLTANETRNRLGVTDFLIVTAGSQLFESLPEIGVVSGMPAKAFFTLSMTDGKSAGATVLLDRYEDRIWATSAFSSGSGICRLHWADL